MANYAGSIEYIQLSLQDELVLSTLNVPTSTIVFTSPEVNLTGNIVIIPPVKGIKVNAFDILLSFDILINTIPVKSIYFNSPEFSIEEYTGIITLPVAESSFNSRLVSLYILDELITIPIGS